MNFVSDANPTVSALYLVNRDKQGKYYRWYDADTQVWSLCGADMQEALNNRGKKSSVGFFPWLGPLTGPKFNPDEKVITVSNDIMETEQSVKVKKEKVVKTPKAKKAKGAMIVKQIATTKSSKAAHPDGTIFFREDRQKWVAMWGGKQEAARPTSEACVKFLKKKYNVDGVVIPKE